LFFRSRESAFDDFPGVGPARRKALLAHFGSVRKAATATVEELAEVEGISAALAHTIWAALHGTPVPDRRARAEPARPADADPVALPKERAS